jgi:hypothetical protein
MKTYAHILSSWRRVKSLNKDIYEREKRETFNLIKAIHLWLDELYEKKGENFDYSQYPLSHREARHHLEGINECTECLSNKYGSKYSKVIRREASKHVEDDMHFIPKKQDYLKLDFWENWSLRYESFSNC